MKFRIKILWTLFGWGFLLGFGVFIWVSYLFMNIAESSFGIGGRIIAGMLALLFFFFIYMRYAFRVFDWFDVQARAELKEKHRGIYRVLALPTKSQRPNNWCAEEITIGDYGWESKLLTKDGLIWLQGLTTEWKMAWRAGFKPEEIEFVCLKPVSQYDWKDFEYDGPKPKSIWTTAIPKNPCPFPVQKTISDQRLKFLKFPISSY